MAPKDLDKLLVKYREGKCTEAESDFINSWYSALGKSPVDLSVEISEEAVASTERRILKKLEAYTDETPATAFIEEKQRSFFWQHTGIAASLILCLAIGYYFLPERVSTPPLLVQDLSDAFSTVENFSGERKRVILPDGSIVQMSPKSTIRFSNYVETGSRELFLEGEAYFDVAHNDDKPFFVYAGDVVTRVLGTSFIVRALDDDENVTVSVKTGKVTVYSRNARHKKTVLVPNQEAVYNRVTDVVATLAVPVVLNEHKVNYTEMHFDETPLPEVLSMLTKAYDIDILFPEETLSGCVLTSSFYEEGLYDRIDVICTAIGATYHIVDAQIVIESQGCNLKTE